MPSTGFPLTGISATSPLPGIKREIKFAQGNTSTSGKRRDVVLVGNKTSAGSETVDTLGTAILSSQDCEDRFGKRSEVYWMYSKYVAVDPNATIYGVAVTESGGTAATRTYTFANAATDTTTVKIEWGGESTEFTVTSGDSANTQAAAASAAINKQAYWPFTAGVAGAVVTIAASNIGPRGDLVVGRVRMTHAKSVATTITAAALTSGTTADDFTGALAALESTEIYYHVASCTAASGLTTTDSGCGEYIAFINTQALPANGKEQIVNFGLVSTQANATTVATSTGGNSARAVFWHAENNDWTPAMIAAHCTAVKRSQEIAYPASNLAGYTNGDGTPFQIPDPYTKTDRPTTTEQESDLDNGVTPIAFGPNGAAYIVRQVTSRSWVGSSATKDYRAREGHIPSVVDYFWSEVRSRYTATRQPNVAADPVQGQRPVAKITYPRDVKTLILGVVDEFTGPAIGGAAILDPSPEAIARMKASVAVVDMVDGVSATCDVEPIRHNLKGNFVINQAGPAY